MLALCGLERLGKAELATEILAREIMLPAVGQGALALECRAAGEALRQFLDPLHDPRSVACVGAERAMLAALDGSCRTPIAGLAELDGDRLRVEGLLLKADCSSEVRGQREGSIAVLRFDHAIAERGELLDGDGAHLLVVLDEQDALAAVWQGAGFRPARRDHASLDRTRQEETRRRALA